MRSLVVSALALMMLLVAAPMASAHAQVTGSNPEDGSSIEVAPEQVSISFNEVPQSQFLTLNVVGPDGNMWTTGEPRVDGQSAVVDIDGLGPVGEYTIAYRVTSADGHPITGTRTFTLTTPGSGTAGAPADGSAPAGEVTGADATAGSNELVAERPEDDGGFLGGNGLFVVIVLAVLAFAGALAFALRKPKSR